MSTQVVDGIPLTLVAEADRGHFRLLELPPEILALLVSDNPPVLELKSSGRHGAEDAGTAVLCTSDKTFNLRQKNSSNTMYLLQPHHLPDAMSGSTLHAIAQCYSSLELTAAKPLDGVALNHMKVTLPVYSSTGVASLSSFDKRALFDALPYSEQECIQSFRRLAAFLHPTTGFVYRPSAALAVQAWHDVLTAATAHGVDLGQPLSENVVLSITAADSAVETAIARAVLDVFVDSSADNLEISDPDRCVSWLGSTLLEVETARKEILSRIFLEKWKELLPEKWRALAEVSKLAAILQSTNNGKSIMLKASVAEPSTVASPNTTTTTVNNSAAGNKRKWHEKFRPTKK